MGSNFVCLAKFSAHQAKQHSQGMPKVRQRGPEARQFTVVDCFLVGLGINMPEGVKTFYTMVCKKITNTTVKMSPLVCRFGNNHANLTLYPIMLTHFTCATKFNYTK